MRNSFFIIILTFCFSEYTLVDIDASSYTDWVYFSFSSGALYDTNNVTRCIFTYDSTGSYDITLTIRYDEQLTKRAPDSALLLGADDIVKVVEQKLVQGTEAELIAMGASNIQEHRIDSILFNHDNFWNPLIKMYSKTYKKNFVDRNYNKLFYVLKNFSDIKKII